MTTVIVNAGNPTAVVNNSSTTTATVEKIKTVTVLDEKVKVVSLGIVGPQGPAGASESGAVAMSGEALGGQRAVVLNNGVVVYASSTTPGDAGRVIGVTLASVPSGQAVTVISVGELTGFNNLTPGEPLYLDVDGVLTQTPPSIGFVQKIGVALAATSALIDLNPPISLI